mmetsp:Transcript_17091/g.40380  ORF Transcript_17091/g.40380 Transcript_17091/m.40380 type:complete len:481 (-) Transcript_17091:77-1519(-)
MDDAEAEADVEEPQIAEADGDGEPSGEAGEGEAPAETEAEEAPAETEEAAAEGEEPAEAEVPADAEEAPVEAVEPEGEEVYVPLEEEEPAQLEGAEQGDEAVEAEVEERPDADPVSADEPPEDGEEDEEVAEEPGPPEDDEGEAELERQMNEEEEEGELIEEGPDPMVELQEKLESLGNQNDLLKNKNVILQRAVINRRAQDKSYNASEKQSEGKVTEHKYQNMLNNVHSERMKLRLQQVMAARMSDELKNQLEAKRQKAIECRDSFQEFKRQIARHAEYARTGKKIQEKIIQEVEEFELDKDAEVEEVRGSNISLKNRLAKLEQALRNKDELAENLHVIDFEQLKIENQQLNEKIEERNEELHKLRKKTIVTVQIITHMREKVQFVQKEYQILKEELAQLDQDLGNQRDLVTKTKHERDEHRQEYASLKQQSGIMNSGHLTKDFKDRGERIKELKDQITQLKKRHGQMSQFIKAHGGKI